MISVSRMGRCDFCSNCNMVYIRCRTRRFCRGWRCSGYVAPRRMVLCSTDAAINTSTQGHRSRSFVRFFLDFFGLFSKGTTKRNENEIVMPRQLWQGPSDRTRLSSWPINQDGVRCGARRPEGKLQRAIWTWITSRYKKRNYVDKGGETAATGDELGGGGDCRQASSDICAKTKSHYHGDWLHWAK